MLADVAAELCARPGPAAGRWWRFDAVVVFLDVSGFTPLSEALARMPEGAEVLASALNGLFVPVIEALGARGGRVAKFAGDGLTALFPCGDDPARAASAAIAASAEVRAHVARHAVLDTPVGRFPLGIKAGIGAGPALVLVGGGQRLEILVTGPSLDRAAAAEHHATSGEIVVDASVAALLPVVGVDRGGFVALDPDGAAREAASIPGPPPALGDHPDGWRFVHPVLAERVAAGQERFLSEHRRVAVVFARLPDLDLGDDDVVARAADLLARAVGVVERWGGTLDKIDCGDKGTKVIAFFGAPLSREGDDERAVRCALELVRQVGASAGVHAGMAFCGPLGGAARREYTGTGVTVNLAARLMQAADRTVVASDELLGPLLERFATVALPPARLKGVRDPVAVWRVDGARPRPSRRAAGEALVGRGAELARVEEALDAAARGSGRVLVVTGELGAGKSRFVDAVVDRAVERGFLAHAGAPDPYAPAPSFGSAWREVWAGVLGIGPDADPAWSLARLATALSAAGHAGALRFVAPVLGLEAPSEDATPPDPAVRRRAVASALAALLDQAARTAPRLLVVDDAHALDPDGAALLEALARRVAAAPVVLLVAGRTVEVAGGPHVLPIALGALSAAEVRDLLAGRSGEVVDEAIAARIAQRTGGNALHVVALAGLARQRGEPLAALGEGIPTSLRALLASRLDAVPERERQVARGAAVVGRAFTGEAVAACLAEPEQGLASPLSHLGAAGLVAPLPVGDDAWQFPEELTHQVAYEALAVATRRELHQRVVAHLSAGEGWDPRVVASHALRSGDRDLAWFFGAKAAAAEERAYRHEAAAAWWTSALGVAPEAERDLVLARVGLCRMRAGRWPEAEAAFDEALGVAVGQADHATELDLRLTRAELAAMRGRFPQARAEATAAAELARELGDERRALGAISQLVHVAMQSGAVDEAVALAAAARPEAERLGDDHALAVALSALGLAARRTDPREARALLEAAVAAAERHGDLRLAARTAGNLALLCQQLGQLPLAWAYHLRNHDLATRAGDHRSASIAVGNLGVLAYLAGDVPGALACLAAHLRLFLDLDDRPTLAMALGNVASGLLAQRRLGLARRYLDPALRLMRAAGLPGLAGAYGLVGARLLEAEGDLVAAYATAVDALRTADPHVTQDRGTTALLVVRLGASSGALPPAVAAASALSVEASAFARWCVAPSDPGLRAAAVAEVDAQPTTDLEARWRRLDLRLPVPFAATALPPGVPAAHDLVALLDQLEAVGALA